MNKNGFTLIELILTFSVSSVIIVILINITVILSNEYKRVKLKNSLYLNQSTLSYLLNNIEINNLEVSTDKTECDGKNICYIFTLSDLTQKKLIYDSRMIKFGDYTYNLDKDCTLSVINDFDNDTYKKLFISITCNTFKNKDFSVNFIYY